MYSSLYVCMYVYIYTYIHTRTNVQVGYLACVLLLRETNEFLLLITNSTKNDLLSNNVEIQVCF